MLVGAASNRLSKRGGYDIISSMNVLDLNEEQRLPVETTEGAVLVLAGAGSGKTRVLTARIAHLVGDMGVPPENILAITFTNKAANEMKERLSAIADTRRMWVSTIHSMCVRILRMYAERRELTQNFSIYSEQERSAVIKQAFKELNFEEESLLKSIKWHISNAKMLGLSPSEYAAQHRAERNVEEAVKVYEKYDAHLKQNNALDFDDLLTEARALLASDRDAREYLAGKFRYIHVDEFQDTNAVQFDIVKMLASVHGNLFVVGDDDQSIYKFRGANIENILSFEKTFPDAAVIRLEQNYRSTGTILDAANGVISHNKGRKEKTLWTENEKGTPVEFHQFNTAYDEAEFIAGDIRRKMQEPGTEYRDFAILYRTNAQSRLFEEKFLMANIPYRLVGGINFYSRKEIKDLLAYLKTIDNGRDDLAVRRIINVPKRGIGAATLNKVDAFAQSRGISFFEALEEAPEIPGIGRALLKIQPFVHLIHEMRLKLGDLSLKELMEEILDKTGYARELEMEDTEEADARLENIDELITKIVTYEEGTEHPELSGFLEEVALVADIDSLEADDNRVLLMTLHSAKGLEFPRVYLAGMEDGIFPSYMSIAADTEEEIEEERRLCYVGITRAMKDLILTSARFRMVRGENHCNAVSRFVREIPENLLERDSLPEKHKEQAPVDKRDQVYEKAREAFRTKTFDPRQFKVVKADSLDYGVGDRVSHIKFGQGTVLEIVEGGRDYEVKVDFDKAGIKRMFASFAKLKKIETL